MVEKITQKLALSLLLVSAFLALLITGLVTPSKPELIDPMNAPPTRVILRQAKVIDQGVQVEWLESQHGTDPIAGYVVERSREGGGFVAIARVQKESHGYLDNDGRARDVYRVVAEDSHKPARRSLASETLTAALPRPGSNVMMVPFLPRVSGASTHQQTTDSAEILQTLIDQTFADFDTALLSGNVAAATSHLDSLQEYQRQALFIWKQLSVQQKASLGQVCTAHRHVFETNLLILPEDDQMDGMLVLAGCNALGGESE